MKEDIQFFAFGRLILGTIAIIFGGACLAPPDIAPVAATWLLTVGVMCYLTAAIDSLIVGIYQ